MHAEARHGRPNSIGDATLLDLTSFSLTLVYFDHKTNNESTGTLEVELGRFVIKQTMLYARPGAGLWGNTGSPFLFEWNFEIGYRYFFK